MADQETPEQTRRRLELRGFTKEQAQAVQQAAAQMAQAQVQRVTNATSNFITTVVALISSAFGFAAALAWNSAIQAWIPTVTGIKQGSVPGQIVYALAATALAIVVIAVLGIISSRIKGGRNMLISDFTGNNN
ncbi:MAG TPA: DUF5654 family protein [Ktedonobacterales bacterium]|nr:DUF5654 family protein [Ktedonobacterales bacterium]